MSPGLAVIGVAVVAGAVVAVSARESRVATLGLVLALVSAPLVGSGPPALLPLAARLVAAILAGYLLWVAVRRVPAATDGSRIGWPAESLLAAAAAVIGLAAGAAARNGPAEAIATALALAVVAAGPLVARGDALQTGLGLALGVTALELLRVGLAGPASALEQLVVAALVVAAAAASALLARAAVAVHGSLDLDARPVGGARRAAVAPPDTRGTPAVAARPGR